MEYKNWIGYDVIKKSGKPFKSGKKVGKIIDVESNPHSNKIGFKMDDGSIVDCYQCKLNVVYSKEYCCPTCNSPSPDDEYISNGKQKYPKIISHNKMLGDKLMENWDGNYMSFDWTEIHFCKKCKTEYCFENSNC